jgi:tape measure domain-containing protein
MASKSVSPVDIKIKVTGAEQLAALKSSFRDLGKQTKLSDKDIVQATQDIVKFAKEVGNSEATIKGQIKAFEGLREQAAMGGKVYRELGVSIGNLKSTLRGSTDELEQQRAGFVKTGNAAKSSAADIKAVISQLEVLKGRARPGSSAFAQIAKDIDALQGRLKEVNIEVKKFNAGFETSQRPAMSLEKIQRQIGRLSEGMKTLNFTSNEYLETQTRIALLGQVQSRSTGRQQVRANAEMFSSAAFQNFAQGPAGKLGLPNTAAALNLEISELQTQLANTTPGESYKRITQEIASKQADLNRILNSTADAYDRVAAAQSASTRRAQKIADQQGYARSSGLAPGAGGYRDPKTGAIIARGRGSVASRRAYGQRGEAFLGLVSEEAEILRQTLALPAAGGTTSTGPGMARRIGVGREVVRGVPAVDVTSPAVGMSEPIKKQANALREAATAYKPYNAEIRKAKAANNGSISGINNLRAALERKRNELPTTTAAFKRLTQQIERLDRQSEKASKGMSRRRFSPGKAAQVAGATISGGIFGGPEGFLGGAIGGAVGGVGGSFAGAALGAQVGQLRQTLGGFAEYAASIKRLRIALEGIAGTQGEYNRALAAAASVTKELNVPQETAIRGITRLTAAVKGAGGGAADAELAFKNITAAITATGGGAEQVEGAVTALVQIFSKGKVSAEEINQIAERLPGTFNKIAEASGRTGPELTKALQSGEVGLNDLMKFLVQLGGEYGELAKKIAGSSESAGARLTVAYNKMRIEIGKALQPVGAEFQEAFLEFITDIGPALVGTAKAVGEGMQFIIRNREAIGTAAALAAKLVLVSKAMKLIAGLKLATIASLAGTGTAAKITGDVSGVAAGKVALLGKALRSLAAIGIVTVGVNYVVNGIGSGKKQENLLQGLESGEFDNTLQNLPYDQAEAALRAEEKNLTQLLAKRDKQRQEIKDLGGLAGIPGIGPMMVGAKRGRLNETLLQIQKSQRILSSKTAAKPKEEPLTVYDDPTGTGTGTGTGGGGGGKAEKVRKSLLDSIRDQGKLVFFTKARIDNELKIGEAQKENNQLLVNKLNNEKISIDFAEQAAQVELQYRDALRAAAGEKNEQAIVREESLKRENATNKLLLELEGERTKEARRFRDEREAIAKASEDELFNLRDQLGLVGKQERIDRYRQSRKDAGDPNAEQQTDLFRQTIDPTLAEGLTQNIAKLKLELEDLVNPINQITGAANAIGTAFSQSFTNAITGATSTKQALADFFKSVGSYFLDMAGQIIAKMITLSILNAVTGLLPGGGGASGFNLGGFGNLSPDAASGTSGFLSGIGTNILGRANGGPVNANTPYIVGERGPELMVPSGNGTIIPNDVFSASRAAISSGSLLGLAGSPGDLGQDGMAESRNYINNNYTTQQAIAQSQAAVSSSSMSMERVIERKAAERQATEMSEPIRVKLDTTVINNVEYLTVEQGLALSESASRKARSQVFSDLRQRPASRSKVGLG